MSEFNTNEWQRYQRHIQLNKFGVDGQRKLKQAHVLIVGAGGLGCPVSQYLAAAGVGEITLVDADVVSRTNLQRQILFGEQDIDTYKVEAAKKRLQANNPNININTVTDFLTEDNVEPLIAKADLVLDCSDNFACRYLINDACLNLKTPWIYASISEYDGQLALFTPETACFRCIFPTPPSEAIDCNSAGVLGSLPGVLGTLQATEALKTLVGLPGSLAGKLLLVEGLYGETRSFNLSPAADCCCQTGITSKTPAPPSCANETTETNSDLSPEDFNALAASGLLIDARSASEHNAFNIGGTQISFSQTERSTFCDAALKLIDDGAPVFIYCQSGVRSGLAKQALNEYGIENIHTLKGGLANWAAWKNSQTV